MVALAARLKENHQFVNGCWSTFYERIRGFNILASTTSGRSGIGKWKGQRVYFYYNHRQEQFVVERA